MALNFLTGLNVRGNIDRFENELQNAVIHPLGTAPTGATTGQIYYDSTVGDKHPYFFNGTSWDKVAFITDMPTVNDTTITITAGTGLSTGGSFTTNTSTPTTITIDHDTISTSGNSSTATATYGGTFTAIDSVTISNGHVTAYNTKTVTLPSSDNTDVDVSVGNLRTRLSQISDDTTIGDAADVTITTSGGLIVTGDLEVQGTTTTVESTVTTFADPIIELNKVVDGGTQLDPTSSGVEVKRAGGNDVQLVWMEDSDDWEFEAYDHAATPAKKKYKIPTSYKTTVGGSAQSTVTHNLGTRDVIVQLYDTSSYETVYADVTRTDTNTVTLDFAVAPSANDITVLVLSAQGEQ